MKYTLILFMLIGSAQAQIQADSSIFVATGTASFGWKTPAQIRSILNLSNLYTTPTSSSTLTNKTIATFNYAADAQATDAYIISLSHAPAAYTTGMIVFFKANTLNTGTATININSLGLKTIVKRTNTVLATGDIPALSIAMIIYDGTNFVLLNPVVN